VVIGVEERKILNKNLLQFDENDENEIRTTTASTSAGQSAIGRALLGSLGMKEENIFLFVPL
jgi:hypothetical protein